MQKIKYWIENGNFPSSVLFVGDGILDSVIDTAAKLQQTNHETISKGIHSDTQVFPDKGTLFPLKFSISAKDADLKEHENAHAMMDWSHKKPIAPYRITILENFERASREVPQALLKILEEPPSKTLFFLTTKNPYQLPETVLSRVSLININTPTVNNDDDPSYSEAENFLSKNTLFENIQLISTWDDAKKREKSRRPVLKICDYLLHVSRKAHPELLPKISKIRQSVSKNGHIKLEFERLAFMLAGTKTRN